MNSRTARALAALRAADPADASTVAQLLDQIPDRQVTQIDLIHDTSTLRRGRARWIYPALAAAAVAAVVVGVVTMVRPGGTSEKRAEVSAPSAGSSASSTSAPEVSEAPSLSPPYSTYSGPYAESAFKEPVWKQPNTVNTGDDPHMSEAISMIQQLLVSAPLLPNSQKSPTAPAVRLQHADYPGDGNLIDRGEWYTVPGTMAEAVTYLKTHPPTGTTLGLTGSGSGTDGPDAELGFTRPNTNILTQIQILYTFAETNGLTALRIDAQGIWIPTRPQAERIPATNSVDVTVIRTRQAPTSAPRTPVTIQRTLTGTAAQQLADAVNALQRSTPGLPPSCPAVFGPESDELVFHVDGHVYDVKNNLAGCRGVSFILDDTLYPGLQSGELLNATVLSLMGLPKNY